MRIGHPDLGIDKSSLACGRGVAAHVSAVDSPPIADGFSVLRLDELDMKCQTVGIHRGFIWNEDDGATEPRYARRRTRRS